MFRGEGSTPGHVWGGALFVGREDCLFEPYMINLVRILYNLKEQHYTMKIQIITSFAILTLFCPFYATSSDFENESTPIERSDIETINQVNDDDSFEDEGQATPIERSDIETINQVNDDDSFEDEGQATPIESSDIETINQVNDD
jgi:hypothetical protein